MTDQEKLRAANEKLKKLRRKLRKDGPEQLGGLIREKNKEKVK